MVNAGSAWPSHAEMTAIGTPCACMMLAQEWRASCNRICLTLAALHSSRQKSLSVSG